jgi:hypothetical protein
VPLFLLAARSQAKRTPNSPPLFFMDLQFSNQRRIAEFVAPNDKFRQLITGTNSGLIGLLSLFL